jgi:hypothetical protein
VAQARKSTKTTPARTFGIGPSENSGSIIQAPPWYFVVGFKEVGKKLSSGAVEITRRNFFEKSHFLR